MFSATVGTRMYSQLETYVVLEWLVRYNPTSLANILLLRSVSKICCITIDTHDQAALVLHKHNKDKMKFIESVKGLYFYNTHNNTREILNQYIFLTLVSSNELMYMASEIKGAKLAQRVCGLVGSPSHENFVQMIQEKMLGNCPIIVPDADRAINIYRTSKCSRPSPQDD